MSTAGEVEGHSLMLLNLSRDSGPVVAMWLGSRSGLEAPSAHLGLPMACCH